MAPARQAATTAVRLSPEIARALRSAVMAKPTAAASAALGAGSACPPSIHHWASCNTRLSDRFRLATTFPMPAQLTALAYAPIAIRSTCFQHPRPKQRHPPLDAFNRFLDVTKRRSAELQEASLRAFGFGCPRHTRSNPQRRALVEATYPSRGQSSEVQAVPQISIQAVVVEIGCNDVSQRQTVRLGPRVPRPMKHKRNERQRRAIALNRCALSQNNSSPLRFQNSWTQLDSTSFSTRNCSPSRSTNSTSTAPRPARSTVQLMMSSARQNETQGRLDAASQRTSEPPRPTDRTSLTAWRAYREKSMPHKSQSATNAAKLFRSPTATVGARRKIRSRYSSNVRAVAPKNEARTL